MPVAPLDYDPEAVEALWADIDRALRSASFIVYHYKVEIDMRSPAWKELKAVQDSREWSRGSREGVEVFVAGRVDSMDRLVSEFTLCERDAEPQIPRGATT